MITYQLEKELLSPVSRYVHRKGFRWQQTELAFYEYRIDLYGFSRKDSSSIAIELKLRNWRRALEQSIIYQLTADYVFAALPRKVISKEVCNEYAILGVGLIGVGNTGRCTQVLAADRSNDVRDQYRQHYISLVSGYKS